MDTPPKVNRTEPYRAVPCSGKAPLDCLGLRVNFAKSILSLSRRVLFLGTVIDSVQMTATVSTERAIKIQHHVASFKEGTARPLKAFQRMLGLMAAASPVLQLGLLHMQPIQFWLKQRVPSTAWRHGRHRVTVTRAVYQPWPVGGTPSD